MSRVFNLSKYNTLVGNDLSLNEKLRVNNDVSLNANVDVSSKLNVHGNAYLNSGLFVGGDLSWNSNNIPDQSIPAAALIGGAGAWTTSGSDVYYNNGNVGIGTSSPIEKLHVNGAASFTGTNASFNTTDTVGIHLGTYQTEYPMMQIVSNNTTGGWIDFAFTDSISNSTSYDDFHGRIRYGYSDGFTFSTAAAARMRISSNGNVGIGTTSPIPKVDVNGAVFLRNQNLTFHSGGGGGNTTEDVALVFNQGGSDRTLALKTDSNGALIGTTGGGGTRAARWSLAPHGSYYFNGGNVGIGTTTPYAKLHVNGTYSGGNITMSYIRRWIIYYQTNSNVQGTAASNDAMSASIYASGDIVTSNHLISSTVYATSDRRIKQNIVDINDNSALETLRLLKPKKYEYIDKFSKTQSTVWGFIAQEVAETLPYATHTGKNEIPNIYQVANVSNDNLLTFNTNIQLEYDASGSLVNDLLLYDASDNRIDVTIQEIVSTTELRIESETVLSNEVFVYGQRVNDFHYLDKPAIFTVGISAVQELDKQQQADKVKIATLETQVAELLTRLTALENAN